MQRPPVGIGNAFPRSFLIRYIDLARKLAPSDTGVEDKMADVRSCLTEQALTYWTQLSVAKPKPQRGAGPVFSRPEAEE